MILTPDARDLICAGLRWLEEMSLSTGEAVAAGVLRTTIEQERSTMILIPCTYTEETWRAIADALPGDYDAQFFKHAIIRALNIGVLTLLIEPRHALMIQTIRQAEESE